MLPQSTVSASVASLFSEYRLHAVEAPMVSPDLVRIYALIRRVDEMWLEASHIGAELAKVGGHPRPWPDPRGVSPLFAKSDDPSGFFPTSTAESGDN
jgi:hypothetical protein